jgi:hypothetical protein
MGGTFDPLSTFNGTIAFTHPGGGVNTVFVGGPNTTGAPQAKPVPPLEKAIRAFEALFVGPDGKTPREPGNKELRNFFRNTEDGRLILKTGIKRLNDVVEKGPLASTLKWARDTAKDVLIPWVQKHVKKASLRDGLVRMLSLFHKYGYEGLQKAAGAANEIPNILERFERVANHAEAHGAEFGSGNVGVWAKSLGKFLREALAEEEGAAAKKPGTLESLEKFGLVMTIGCEVMFNRVDSQVPTTASGDRVESPEQQKALEFWDTMGQRLANFTRNMADLRELVESIFPASPVTETPKQDAKAQQPVTGTAGGPAAGQDAGRNNVYETHDPAERQSAAGHTDELRVLIPELVREGEPVGV